MFVLNFLKSLAYAPTVPLLWAMIADVADYSEYKNYRRATGFVFAGVVFALKAGLGIGGAILGFLLSGFWVCVRYRGRAKRYGYKGDCTFLQSDSGYDIWNGSSCLMLLSYYKKIQRTDAGGTC